MALKDLIKEKRRSKGLTQQALADLLNTEKGVISNWENGRRSPSLENMTTLSRFFDIDINELMRAGKATVSYQSPNFKPSVANESIALYSLNVEAGFDTGLENSPDYIEGYIQMPGIGKNDGSWVVSGHSMYPTISKGSRVVLRKIEDWNLIEWNNVYVIWEKVKLYPYFIYQFGKIWPDIRTMIR